MIGVLSNSLNKNYLFKLNTWCSVYPIIPSPSIMLAYGNEWEREQRGEKDESGQSLLLSCCKPLHLFSFVFLERLLDIRFRNLRHCCPTTCLVHLPRRVPVQPLNSVCGSPSISQECGFKRLYPLPPLSLSFFLIYSNRLFSVSFPYSVVWKTCTFICWG